MGELDERISILENNDMIILKSNDEIIYCKLVDLYGIEVNYGMKQIGENEVLFDKIKLARGVYFIRIITNDKIKHLQNIKLIIN